MLNRVIQKIKFLSLRTRVSSLDQLKKIAPFDRLNPEAIRQNREKLKPYYEQYVKEVSRADMAASLELAAFMYTLCQVNHYTKLLDMGSGLSSFVFRLYAKENPDTTVFSVDDDAAWLEKTKDYLKQHQLGVENIFTLKQFLKSKEEGFDCILHDLNFVEVRINYIEYVMRIAKSKGLVILDDVHKPDYLLSIIIKLKKLNVKMYDLKPITFDSYGRYSLAVIKEE